MPKLKANYIDTGKVHFIFREFSRNPLDVAAFVLARCVGDDKALATIDLLFAQQDKWAFVDNPLEPLLTAVRPTGLSHDKAMECLKDQAKADAMQKIVKTAVDVVKMQGTPTFVIDGKVYGGELSIDRSRRDLEAAGQVSGGARAATSPAQPAPPGERAGGDDDQRRQRIPGDDEQRRIVGAIARVDRRRDARRRGAGERAGRARDSAARPRAAPRSARRAARSTAAGSAQAMMPVASRRAASPRVRAATTANSTTTAPSSSTSGASEPGEQRARPRLGPRQPQAQQRRGQQQRQRVEEFEVEAHRVHRLRMSGRGPSAAMNSASADQRAGAERERQPAPDRDDAAPERPRRARR